MITEATVAYFSMEVALEARIPTYSGGLGVLAGDTLRAAVDLKLPMVGVTLLHRRGYFEQSLDANGQQSEENPPWNVEATLIEIPLTVSVAIEGRNVYLRCWRYDIRGASGFTVPVYFLDSNLTENSEWDRTLTDYLYGGDSHYRLCQEVLLGVGGVRTLRALGYGHVIRFHMNEGHASMLALELLNESASRHGRNLFNHDDVESVRKLCVFTTHTPVPAGHDQFPLDMVGKVLGRTDIFQLEEVFCCKGVLNMTYLALNLSHYVNGVAKRHGDVSRQVLLPKKEFIHYEIDSITNGVHAATWASPSMAAVFDRFITGWREDNAALRSVSGIPRDVIWEAHMAAKTQLISKVNEETGAGMIPDALTIGCARRATAYKRVDLIFTDLDKLRGIPSGNFPLQIIFAGKAHPQDRAGKDVIHRICAARDALKGHLKIVYLQNYDVELAKAITSGADVWLNTPRPPLEASGTSGMKAALNGVPSLSVMDGWWIEGCIPGVTGWRIGGDTDYSHDDRKDSEALYDLLEYSILPIFYQHHDHFVEIMRHCIALNGAYFNTQRMLQQYVLKAYFR